ncbi:condensation domain-containing protein [Streptomyces sp. NBC_01518]|uniref:condensation domain-containing protein n=1 Tax=Streptomyces sp. NBC_01518 TaxID=2903891 RepID=UPI00386D51B2
MASPENIREMNLSVTGCSARSGRLTWAHQDIIDYARRDPYVPSAVVDTPERPRLDDCLAAIRTVVRRHESLRTLFVREGDSPVRQEIQGKVDIPVILVDHTSSSGGGRDSLLSALSRKVMDSSTEILFCLGFLVDNDNVACVVVSAHHLILDGWGFQNLVTELLGEIRSPGEGPSPQEVFQQLDQVEWESSGAGERGKEAAIAHHREDALLLASRRSSWGKPASPKESVHSGGISLGLSSVQLEDVAKRLSVGTPSLLLAACARTISASLDLGAFLVRVHCANRFNQKRMRSVTRLKTTTTMPFTEPGGTLRQVAAETQELSLVAHHYAQFPPEKYVRVLDDVLPDWRVGAPLIVDFNDRRVIFDPAVNTSPGVGVDLTPFPDHPVVTSEPVRRTSEPFLGLKIDPCLRTGGAAVKLETNLLSRQKMEDYLSGIRDQLDQEFRSR